MLIDLHIHTSNSDGIGSLQQIAHKLATSITNQQIVLGVVDHHYLTIDKVTEYKNIKFIPGMEVSVKIDDGVYHLVVYSSNPKITPKLKQILEIIVAGYNQRALKMIKQLKSAGFNLPIIIRDPKLPAPIYTYDIAKQLSILLKIPTEKETIEWAKKNGNLLFVKEDNFFPGAHETITALHSSNFNVFLAHPGSREKYLQLINKIKTSIDGLEVFYPKHDLETTSQLLNSACHSNLMISGGSDYHGFGRGINDITFLFPSNLYNPKIAK